MSKRLNKEREKELQPKRIEFAKQQIEKKGMSISFESTTELRFLYKGFEITFFPYSGWASGKTINDGRGLDNLLKQLQP